MSALFERAAQKLSLRARIFLFFALLGAGGALLIILAAVFGFSRLKSDAPISAFITTAFLGSCALLGLTAWIWTLFDKNVAKPLIELASHLRAQTHAQVDAKLAGEASKYLGDIGPAAAAMAQHLQANRTQLEAVIEREKALILAERARLETILHDAPAACVLCSMDHRVALYNQQAAEHLTIDGELGLGRSLFEALRAGPILDAVSRLERRAPTGGAVQILCATPQAERFFSARLRLFSGAHDLSDAPGYVVMLTDVTSEATERAAREALLRDVFDQIRRPVANLQTVLAALASKEGESRAQLQAAMADETKTLANAAAELNQRYEQTAGASWMLSNLPVVDVLDPILARAQARGLALQIKPAPLLEVRCDGFATAQLLGDLAERLALSGRDADLTLSVLKDAQDVIFDLSWRGPVAQFSMVEQWLNTPLSGGYQGLSLREALKSHDGDIWPEASPNGLSRLRTTLRHALAPPEPKGARAERRIFHDFSLLQQPQEGANRRLDALSMVVFDTETTGLAPQNGDKIVQIAALRIVNGRILADECFERLIHPGRKIPQASINIHHITNEMVNQAPRIDEVGPLFHRFCGDGVLVAHNAAFDLAFLAAQRDEIGCAFHHEVIDTVLMSVVLFGRSADHTLDALAARLGVEIPAAARHTAMGDALATAQAAVKMISMLRGKGVKTMADLEAASAPYRAFVARGSLVGSG